MKRTPVAMFVYDRADNTEKTIEALLANTLASETELYVFSDGGRDSRSWRRVGKVRRYLRSVRERSLAQGMLRDMTIVERGENFFIERNIVEGIAEVFRRHDRVIALEDDIVTGPHFLRYMNEALELYADVPEVMHVSGFTNLSLPQGVDGRDFYFTPHMSGWGWATWRDKWQAHFRTFTNKEEALSGMTAEDTDTMQYGGAFPCLRSLDRSPIPWDICWELAIHKARGLCLTPAHTMVRNAGLSGGTHFRSCRLLQRYEYDRRPLSRPLRLTRVENPKANPETETMFARAITDWGIRYTPLGKMIRWTYKKMAR